MKFYDLTISNFLTIGDAEVQLNDRGLLLIQGVNGDDPSADSNGAGKSSIVDALCWALYGVTARGVTGDAVVNKSAEKNCVVCLTFEDGADKYLIQRFRKHATKKNQVLICRVDAGVNIDMSKGTDRETQEVIEKVIGCSLDVFMAAVYSGQDSMVDLPGMTDKMLKTLIEEAAGVEVLTEAYTVARSRHLKVKTALDVAINAQTDTTNSLARLTTELAAMTVSSVTFEAERKERAKAELVKVLPIKAQIKEISDDVLKSDESALQSEFEALRVELEAQRAQQASMDALNVECRRLEQISTRLKTELEYTRKDVLIAQKASDKVDSLVGSSCGECGKAYRADDLVGAHVHHQKAVSAAQTLVTPAVLVLHEADKALKTAVERSEAFKLTLTDVSAVASRQRVLSALIAALHAKRSTVKALEGEIERHTLAAKTKLTETNPWTKALESKNADVERDEALFSALTATVAKVGDEAELLADAVAVFGPAGVRAHILDTVTPFLNDRTQDYLGALADGNIHAIWSTLSKTAKGDLKEKFNIEVSNDKGAESFMGLSGGEKRKVRLATAMALQDMVASRATKPIELFIADEVDHALDEAGLERLMGLLERKAKERGTVLVISHNSLADWCDQIITVEKSGGFATVSGNNLRS